MTLSRQFTTLVLLTFMISPTITCAEIYSWKDAQGKVHFGDRPPINRTTEQVNVRINTYTAPAEITHNTFASTSKDKVVLYTTQRCGYCKKAKQYLAQNRIRFTEYDVETSNKGKRDFKKLRGKAVPVILVGKQRMNGFTASSMASMLTKAGYKL